ncbi:hypothetical protein FOWG_08051 [Fusarium oxysporum f. sp. lycopersici MN25]|uniref:Uncharacterized protein n=1 Tax=Fusarium oxysporum Fo47 TaxID=660027 RepID=W9JXT6_FUSOX|nr:hypothetical protein FOZG_10854 [Fusarium oxysporum Fo47]EWZ36947.1 hypothetical protein FOZG_10854 [Fusarium oxysporum Fo47]EWZ90390.1 hypothetical protein FOWG_08051 [Fusarium oxysporum f. sp. lycopersici MN25]EWZ90391.1 hypothetical protein FOWG_08051 [Fusarium oxysporum f. sp. lycopersici MN25]
MCRTTFCHVSTTSLLKSKSRVPRHVRVAESCPFLSSLSFLWKMTAQAFSREQCQMPNILSRDPFVMIGAVSISDRSRGQSLSILQDLRKSRASIINATERCSRSRLFTAKASPNSDLVNRRVSICMDILMMDGSMSLRIASMVCSLKSSKIVTDLTCWGSLRSRTCITVAMIDTGIYLLCLSSTY